MVSETVSPENGRRPQSISKSTHPNAQMSVRLSTGRPRACSGLMYAAVPRINPASVPCMVTRREIRRGRIASHCFGQPEVEDFYVAARRDFHVRRLQIAVHDAPLMSRFERVGDLAGDLERLANPKWPLRNPIGECQALDHLHDEGGYSGRVFEAVNMSDVWMVERREDSRFALKSGEPFRIAGELIRQYLDRHVAIELRIMGSIDFAHAAAPERGEDVVRP